MPGNTETSQRICSINSCGRNSLCIVFTSCPLQVSFSFLTLLFFFSSIPVCLCHPVYFFLALFAFLLSVLLTSSLTSSLYHLLNCFHLPLFHFFFFSLSYFLLCSLFLALPVFDCPPRPSIGLSNPQNGEHKRCDTSTLIFWLFLYHAFSCFSLFWRWRSRLQNEWQVLPNMKIFLKSIRVRPLRQSLTFSSGSSQWQLSSPCSLFYLRKEAGSIKWNFLLQLRVKQLLILVSMESTLLGSEEVVSLAFRVMHLALTSHRHTREGCRAAEA